MIFLLLTGLRVGETKRLQWSYIDFENKILTVPRELTKSDREHQLPLSDFLLALLKKRHVYRKNSIWVCKACQTQDKADMQSGTLKHCTADSTSFKNAQIAEFEFFGTNLRKADFTNAQITGSHSEKSRKKAA